MIMVMIIFDPGEVCASELPDGHQRTLKSVSPV